jgi:hypothetical protein
VLVCKQSCDILLTKKLLFLCILELKNICVLEIQTNCMLNISVLVDWSNFNYVQIISMMYG